MGWEHSSAAPCFTSCNRVSYLTRVRRKSVHREPDDMPRQRDTHGYLNYALAGIETPLLR